MKRGDERQMPMTLTQTGEMSCQWLRCWLDVKLCWAGLGCVEACAFYAEDAGW